MSKRPQRVRFRFAERLVLAVLLTYLISDCLGTLAIASPSSAGDRIQPADLQEIRTLARQHRWSDAAAQIEILLKQHPDDSQLFYWRGFVRFQLSDNIGAIIAFRSAERLGLNTSDLHRSLGLAYWRIHQYLLFERQMDKAIQLNSQDYEPYYALGRHYQSIRDDCTHAEELLQKALQLRPDEPKIIFSMGVCQEMLGHREDAMSTYTEAMHVVEAKHEKYSWPFQEMARLLLAQDPEQALKLAQRAVELQPDLDAAHQILAKVEDAMGKYPEAIAELLTVTRLDPSNASPHYALFVLYKKAHNPQAAEAQLKQFEELKALYAQP
jgi:tetratricopeptide (TPR) repeat protein